ncbi:DUF2496 domain-containing protein [Thalassotalea sp. HSM 43]|uniref:DUF2496 domain-containing protein n=1 Tax=Thalassotalea sp. HSM 43 TaxID=2552945 RepID=UPI001080605E|nr:DUF2496 domain-containing protein [Thalassotalea sp. HSM 43]QBY03748.1 DUF2496 domain-containing protein [Thalassotalea sp. HSM 43]
MSLETAPDEIKLAIDLIQLLEENKIESDVAIKALRIVIADFEKKRDNELPQ